MPRQTRLVPVVAAAALALCGALSATTASGANDASPASARAAVTAAWGKTRVETLDAASRTYVYRVKRKATTARFALTDLPENYDLALTDAKGKTLAKSRRGGTAFEEIVRRLPQGTYRVTVSAADGTPASGSFRLTGAKYAKPTVISERWFHDQGRDKHQYVIAYINPTNRPLALTATVETFDAAGGFVSDQDVDEGQFAPPYSKGLAFTSSNFYGGMFWGDDIDSVKRRKGVEFRRSACAGASAVAPLSKVRLAWDADDAEWLASGLVRNRNRTEANMWGVFTKYDHLGVPYQAYREHLGGVDARRKVSFSTDVLTISDEAPSAWGWWAYDSTRC